MPAAFNDQRPSPTFSICTLGAAGAGGACATFAGTGSDTGGIGRHLRDGDIQRLEAVLLLDDAPGELDAAVVAVIGIRDLDGHVAHHGIRGQVFDPLDEILVIERHLDVTSLDGKCDDVAVSGGAARNRGLDYAMRREPELPEPLADRTRVGRRLGARLGPRMHAADDLHGSLLAR